MSQTVDRALTILGALGERPMGLDDVADLLGVHKSTGLRLLQALERQRFVRRDVRHQYRLASRLIALGQQALADMDVRRDAAPLLEKLNRSCGHTVHLATLEDDVAFYIDKYDGREPVRLYSRIGKQAPLHCTGVGKVLLAGLPDHRLEEITGQIEYVRHTANTIPDAAAMLAEVARVREQGFAVDDREHEEFANCVAAPIRNASGDVLAAVSITTPVMVRPLDQLMDLLPELLATTEAISRGWLGEGLAR